MRTILIYISALLFTIPFAFAQSDRLVVHEWGTFTSLQDEGGRTLGGLNADDEPLPLFVHDLLNEQTRLLFGKGLPIKPRPDITMRLETPVMYFHLPPNSPPRKIDVSVKFNQGVLSQFYPDATTRIKPGTLIPPIDEKTVGFLSWPNLQIGTQAAGPKTDAHVWLAPRQVNAANITATNGESERYLFYRGVGHIDAPIVATNADASVSFRWSLAVNIRPDPKWGNQQVRIPQIWLAQFGDDGSCNALDLGPLSSDRPHIVINDPPAAAKRPTLDLPALRASMKKALMTEGLFDDEADAMLNTWEKSYFKSAGLRFFYIVPRSWTDDHLPLELSTDAEIQRVMIGRLEMVSSEQRNALMQLTSLVPLPEQAKKVEDLYNSLGRFRAALILDEVGRHPIPALKEFVSKHGL
ncbi:MAG TPA: hypothetical protein VHS31_07705 [Tepidisphaeraceae bacterium]|jgi:hypothetical protein|nr:hypothetical protein [Tepidisphaeraceae bacterium]